MLPELAEPVWTQMGRRWVAHGMSANDLTAGPEKSFMHIEIKGKSWAMSRSLGEVSAKSFFHEDLTARPEYLPT